MPAREPSSHRRRLSNSDPRTVDGFGEEWSHFDQSGLSEDERRRLFAQYFRVFPRHVLGDEAVGFDAGCGTGRWAECVAPQAGALICVDASAAAAEVARRRLARFPHCQVHVASIEEMPIEDGSMDFGYSLGVLHHVPDTARALRSCVRKLKPGAPFLVYLYYALDGRPLWFRRLWRLSDLLRRAVSRLPFRARLAVSALFAGLVYLPLSRLARVAERLGAPVDGLPLSAYRDRSFYSMRTDALDRFGTRLERRFTRDEIVRMFEESGCERVTVSDAPPYWCAVGYRL